MFTTNRQSQVASEPPAVFATDQKQLSHPFEIQNVERIFREYALIHIGAHEAPGIVTRQAIGHLGQVVRTKRQERSMLGNVTGAKCRARGFDHDTQLVVELGVQLVADRRRNRNLGPRPGRRNSPRSRSPRN